MYTYIYKFMQHICTYSSTYMHHAVRSRLPVQQRPRASSRAAPPRTHARGQYTSSAASRPPPVTQHNTRQHFAGCCQEFPPGTMTSNRHVQGSNSASKSVCQSRPQTVAISKKGAPPCNHAHNVHPPGSTQQSHYPLASGSGFRHTNARRGCRVQRSGIRGQG